MFNYDFQIDIIPLIVLIIFILKERSRLSFSVINTIFKYNVLALVSILFFEMGIIALSSVLVNADVYFLRLFALCFFVSIALFYMFWGFFIISYINSIETGGYYKKLSWVATIATSLIILLFIFNLFFGFIYYIDDNGVYQKGMGYLIFFSIFAIYSYSFSFYGFIYSFKLLKGSHQKRGLTVFFLLSSLMFTISNLQFIYRNKFSPWAANSLLMLILYLYLQRENSIMDSLTGIGNRKHFEQVLARKFGEKNLNAVWHLILFDLDDFKKFNGKYGRINGDKALIRTSRLLLKTFPLETSTVFRYGGDEFAVIFDSNDTARLITMIQNFKKELAKPFKCKNGQTAELVISYGIADYRFGHFLSVKAMVDRAGEFLRLDKENKKRNKD